MADAASVVLYNRKASEKDSRSKVAPKLKLTSSCQRKCKTNGNVLNAIGSDIPTVQNHYQYRVRICIRIGSLLPFKIGGVVRIGLSTQCEPGE
jgi:hypothetical protein